MPNEKLNELFRGICRRKSPSPLTIEEEDADDNAWKDDDFIFCHVGWPLTYKDDYCGEFQSKEIKPGEQE